MNNNKSQPVLSRGKKIVFSLIAAGIALFILIIGAELLIRFLASQETLFPRWDYSREFGGLWPKNATIVNQCPGRWRFVYRTNQFGFRGEAVLPGEENGKENIVVLGDSFSFGSGVNEGEEYPAVIRERLGHRYNVINIAVPGWGLTHQIKMYYRFGRLYRPRIVLLQFCANDLFDNYLDRVTVIEDGSLAFRPTDRRKGILCGGFISNSGLIQNSQLYAFIRNYINDMIYQGREERDRELQTREVPPHEKFYSDLLRLFVEDLSREGIKVFMFAPEDAVYYFSHIRRTVEELAAAGKMKYIEVTPWLENVEDYGSPQGHSWGTKAHRIVGDNLSGIITRVE